MKNTKHIYLLSVAHYVNNKFEHKEVIAIYSSYKKARKSLEVNRNADELYYQHKKDYSLSKIYEYDYYTLEFRDTENNKHKFVMGIQPKIMF